MTIDELKKAYAKGETIQFRLDGKGWTDWENPRFDCEASEYRVKPGQRPFENAGELLSAWERKMGFSPRNNTMPLIWVRCKESRLDFCNVCITGFFDNGVILAGQACVTSFDVLLRNYTFLDGSPCGMGVEDEQ